MNVVPSDEYSIVQPFGAMTSSALVSFTFAGSMETARVCETVPGSLLTGIAARRSIVVPGVPLDGAVSVMAFTACAIDPLTTDPVASTTHSAPVSSERSRNALLVRVTGRGTT